MSIIVEVYHHPVDTLQNAFDDSLENPWRRHDSKRKASVPEETSVSVDHHGLLAVVI